MNKKYLVGLLTLALAGTDSLSTQAQEKKKTVGEKIEHTASSVGNKTAEVASKGKARVTDKKSDVWIGPEGQTIYVSDDNRYYWVNGKGKHIYVSEAALKARNKD